jgi:RNA ligase
LDTEILHGYIASGHVDVRYHKTLPLRICTFSKKVVYENAWDSVTEKCRGLIVDDKGIVIARPFEKFFTINTDYRPETWIQNLPNTEPIVLDKLDGSLGILYKYQGVSGIATKGSFHSDQAEWATAWYRKNCPNPQWPVGFTPVFEIIAESVQHHVVDYAGQHTLVLLALIDNETGEEASYNECYHWAYINGLKVADVYAKTLADILAEDRSNAEGYVCSWPRPGQPPLKVKVKHPGFLKLQKVVHAATPKAILEMLTSGDVDQLNDWMNNLPASPLVVWIQDWVCKFNAEYGRILLQARQLYQRANINFMMNEETNGRKAFAEYVKANGRELTPVCFAMLDGKNHSKIIWKLIAHNFREELSKPFAVTDGQEVYECSST